MYHCVFKWVDFSHILRSYFSGNCRVPIKHPQSTRWSWEWRHNEHEGVSNHQPYDCLLNRLFRRRSTKTSKLRVTGPCKGNSPHKGPVTRKMFTFDDVIMCNTKIQRDYMIQPQKNAEIKICGYLFANCIAVWISPKSVKISYAIKYLMALFLF